MTLSETSKLPPAPDHLRPDVAAWWDTVLAEYVIDGAMLGVLEVAADALHRCRDAREVVLADGAVTLDRYGSPKAHPMVAVERDARTAYLRAVRELALDVPPPDNRPARRGGQKW